MRRINLQSAEGYEFQVRLFFSISAPISILHFVVLIVPSTSLSVSLSLSPQCVTPVMRSRIEIIIRSTGNWFSDITCWARSPGFCTKEPDYINTVNLAIPRCQRGGSYATFTRGHAFRISMVISRRFIASRYRP